MLKKFLLTMAVLLTACALPGYEIRSMKDIKVDADLSDWKGVSFRRVAGERLSSDPLRYKGVQDAAVSLGIVWDESRQAFLLAGKIWDESKAPADKLELR
ncbi:MAG: hypothetical protein IJ992_01395 [Lentisphaeria bacterium]|nr:hypothetical protein [Lentisphaeria bacterium]